MRRIHRTRFGFRMELHAHEGKRAVSNTFVRPIIGIHEPRFPSFLQRLDPDGISMVLGCNVTTACSDFYAGLILAAMPELQLIGVGTCGKGQDLMAKTHAEDRDPSGHD